MDALPAVPLDLTALRRARERIRDAVVHTAQWHNELLSDELGVPVRLKLENLQRTGSFKLRGATHKMLTLLGQGPRPAGVVAASAGNHRGWHVPRRRRGCVRWW